MMWRDQGKGLPPACDDCAGFTASPYSVDELTEANPVARSNLASAGFHRATRAYAFGFRMG
jgi:hypothetical protein